MNSDTAAKLCMEGHKGQLRKGGDPYWTHPFRVASGFEPNSDEAVVAFLHDLLEDTTITVERLREEGLTPTQEDALIALSRNPGEKYFDYINRVKGNPLAITIKLADLEDNTPGAPSGMQERYEKSKRILRGEEE